MTLLTQKPRTRTGPKAEADWRYYENNRERILLRARKYREANKQKVRNSQAVYRSENRDKLRAYHRSPEHRARKSMRLSLWNAKNKKTVLTHYGKGEAACLRCKVADLDVLTIDHISGNGRKHREQIKTHSNAGALYRWLIRNGFPDGFQTLCSNCNLKKFLMEKRGEVFRIVDGGAAF